MRLMVTSASAWHVLSFEKAMSSMIFKKKLILQWHESIAQGFPCPLGNTLGSSVLFFRLRYKKDLGLFPPISEVVPGSRENMSSQTACIITLSAHLFLKQTRACRALN